MTTIPMILERHPDCPYSKLKAIGYWCARNPKGGLGLLMYVADNLVRGPFPNPKDFVDPTWDSWEKQTVLDYLRGGQKNLRTFVRWKGYSWCRFSCGISDCDMGNACITDGVYVWPEGFVHYIDKHDVRVPNEFVEHVLDVIERQHPDYEAILERAITSIDSPRAQPMLIQDFRQWLLEKAKQDDD